MERVLSYLQALSFIFQHLSLMEGDNFSFCITFHYPFRRNMKLH